MTGKQVMQQVTTNTIIKLNVAKLPAGVYMLKVNNGTETRSVKFVKG